MASPLYPGNKKFKLLLLVVASTSILQPSTPTDGAAGNISLAKAGCQYECGNVTIPYPFGIGDGCFLNEDYIVNCTADDVAILNSSGKSLVLLEIDVAISVARVQSPISWHCNYTNGTASDGPNSSSWLFSVAPPFTVSQGMNKFTVIGCATVAFVGGESENAPYSACGSFCYDNKTIDNITNCSGIGCCQAAIPSNLARFNLSFSDIDNSLVQSSSPCSYGFIVDDDWFDPTHLNLSNFQQDYYRDGMPLVLDWVFYNETCAEARKNKSSYKCLDKNSICMDYPLNGRPTYYCSCSDGYEGNSYLEGGCQDINECDDDENPCTNNGTCINTIGSYNCFCPRGTHSDDPENTSCTPIPITIPAGSNKQPQVKLVIGTSIGLLVFIICIFTLLIKCQKRQLAKEKERFFKQNGGQILYQKILSKQIDTVTIFTVEDLKKATNNYDKSRELGVDTWRQ